MESENHVASHESYPCVWMSCTIVKKKCETSSSKCYVALHCLAAMKLRVCAMVGLVVLAYQANVPTMSCIRLMRSGDTKAEVSCFSV